MSGEAEIAAGARSRSGERIVVGVLIGFGAQVFIDRELYLPGVAMYLFAVGIAVWGGRDAARRLLDTSDFAVARVSTPPPLVLLASAITAALVLATVVLFDVVQPTNGDLAAWLLAVLALIGAVSAMDTTGRPANAGGDLGPRRRWSTPAPETVAIVAMCLAIATLPRLLDLGSLPFGFWFDEAENALQGRRIRADGSYRPVFIPGTFLAPAHLGYAMALSGAVFGDTVVGARMVTVTMGLASVAAIGAVARRLWGPWAACIAMLLLGLSRWHVTISRIAMHNIAVPVFALTTLALLLRALKTGRRFDWALVGLVAGVGLGFYSAFSASLLAVGCLALFVVLRHGAVGRVAVGIGLSIVVLLALVGPVLKFAQQDTELFFLRQEQTSLFSIVPEDERTDRIIDNVGVYLRSFNDRGDNNGRHNDPGQPMLSFWVAPLAIVGLALSVANIRRPLAAGLVVWFVLGLVPGVLSNPGEAPNTLRSIGTMAPAYLFACLTVTTMTSARPFSGVDAGSGPAALLDSMRATRNYRPLVAAGVLVVLVAGGAFDVSRYFGEQSEHPLVWGGHSTPETLASTLALDAADTHEVWLVEGLHAEPSTMRFFIEDFTPFQRYRPGSGTLLPFAGERDVLVIGHAATGTSRDLITSLYPEASVTDYAASDADRPEIVTIEIPGAAIRARQGVLYSDAGGSGVIEPTFNVAARTGAASSWSAGLVTPLETTYTFRVTGDAKTSLVLDGTAMTLCPAGGTQASVRLGRGGHDLSVFADPGFTSVGLEWRIGNGGWESIQPRFLVQPEFHRRGLFASHFTGEVPGGEPIFRQIDGNAHFEFWIGRLESPSTTQWRGAVKITNPGMHQFWLSSDDPASLEFNGANVASIPLEGGEALFEANLEAGAYPIVVTATDIEPWAYVRFEWATPGEARGRIPTDRLTPDLSGQPPRTEVVGTGC